MISTILVITLRFMDGQEIPVRVGLRERNKGKRRDAIISATLALLREQSIESTSIERIAERAEVSPATVYNLMGSREQLLLACVDRVIMGVVDTLAAKDITGDPIANAMVIVEQSAAAFIDDGAAYRQIIGEVGAYARSGSTMAFDPAQLQIAAMRAAQRSGSIRDDADPAAVGRQIYLSYNGALFAWAAGRLTDDGLHTAVKHGLFTALAAFATESRRAQFLVELDQLGRRLARGTHP
jgi:AcrR family transcriptional regulator